MNPSLSKLLFPPQNVNHLMIIILLFSFAPLPPSPTTYKSITPFRTETNDSSRCQDLFTITEIVDRVMPSYQFLQGAA